VPGPSASYKYNVRFWLDVLWSPECPEAWLYECGYIELADCPFARDDFDEPAGHISNLAGGGSADVPHCRLWTSDEYREYLLGSELAAERELGHELVERVSHLCSRSLAAVPLLGAEPEDGGGELAHEATREPRQLDPSGRHTSVCNHGVVAGAYQEGDPGKQGAEGAAGGACAAKDKWRRFGVDIAVDDACQMWVIEFNCNPGMRAPRSSRGDAKRRLAARFLEHERMLRGSCLRRHHRLPAAAVPSSPSEPALPHATVRLGGGEKERGYGVGGRRGGEGSVSSERADLFTNPDHAFGFRRLDVKGWPCT